jgi:hypothetical protein
MVPGLWGTDDRPPPPCRFGPPGQARFGPLIESRFGPPWGRSIAVLSRATLLRLQLAPQDREAPRGELDDLRVRVRGRASA